MKSFADLQESLENSDGVVFSFGRFQPPHRGHQILVNKVLEIANSKNYDNMIYTSQTQDKNNPLSWSDKVDILSRMFPDADISRNKKAKNPYKVLSELSDEGYKNVVMVVGSDRMDDFKNMSKYTEGFDSFELVSAGERKDGISGTEMRKFAKDGDFINFNAALPKTYEDGRKIYEMVRKGN